ncbi:acriflavin resistance protein [Paenibacillus curdlanolyticus YK9]|uniref:Acriflavin resistance protein n=1 Tax=Paenibacillus curdlanolyticus YK9 TaxID=717606 RepID=E0I4E0_9BACL|nr:efflux RND transporter permease subunit [Paenibacillus curdlanolyticus]EFM13154.1 acriflavin resistance protein [Paenibacillus curdlanolyticus YK9]
MRSLIKFSLNNKFALWIMTIIVLLAGIFSGTQMKMETLPDITIPIVSVNTVYPGAAPEEVMENVTKQIEQHTRNLEGVKMVTSTSMENVSSVVIEYDFSMDMEKAKASVSEALSGLKFPDGVEQPDITRISLNAFPVLSLSAANKDLSLEQLTKLVESEVVPSIEGVEGVSSVQITGQHVKSAELTFKQDKLQQYGLTEDLVKGIIQGSAVSAPLGLFTFGNEENTIVVDGNVWTEEDLKNIQIPVVPAGAGAGAAAGGNAAPGQSTNVAPATNAATKIELPTVKLSEIADLNVVGKASSISRTNGEDAIGISVVKAADANTVDVVNNVKDQIKKLMDDNKGLSIVTALDQGKPIEQSVNTMLSKAFVGAAFAIVIILIFLRDIRSTVIAVVSIPLSIFIALLILNQMDVTLNIMTLGAMTVAIGRVIDDSIVVIENVYRRMSLSSEKLTGKQLILESTREMFVPILASTIVTIAVFLPMGFVSGAIGQIFMPFALTIVFSLLASLLVAITVVPMLAHMMFRKGLKNAKHHEDKPGRLAGQYRRLLRWTLDHKLITSLLAIVLLVGSCMLTPLIGFSFLPSEGEKTMMITYNPAPGETLEQVKDMATKAEKELVGRKDVELMQYTVGGSGNPFSPGASKQGLVYLTYDEKTKNFEDEKTAVVDLLKGLGGQGEWKQQDFSGGGIGGSGLSLIVYGPDMETLQTVVKDIADKWRTNKDLTNVDTSLSETYKQYRLVADQAKLSQYGLTAGQVAMALAPVRQQPQLTTIEKDSEKLSVYVHVDEKTYSSISDLENEKLMSPAGFPVTLKDVVKVEEGTSPNTITRRDDKVYAEVTADAKAADLSKVSTNIQKELDTMKLPAGVTTEMGGATQDMNEAFSQLILAMLAAVAIVYLVLVITFGGALTPFTILFSLPFTVIGAFVGLYIAGETISVTALIGMLMLIGIVVTNAIVLIDRVIQKQREGLAVRDALLEAAGTRLRPILMTAIATIGALLPLALGFESGGLISKGLGITVIGGLTSSTLLTLIFVPMVYELINRKRKFKDATAE